MKTFLHVGCGPKRKDRTTAGFANWNELRFDIDESVQPDLVGTMTDMSSVSSDSVDAVFSSHNMKKSFYHWQRIISLLDKSWQPSKLTTKSTT
jgi:hypothetical protein